MRHATGARLLPAESQSRGECPYVGLESALFHVLVLQALTPMHAGD